MGTFVQNGTSNGKTSFLQTAIYDTTNNAITGTDDLEFTEQSTVDFTLDSNTLELVNGNTLRVKPELNLTSLTTTGNISSGGLTVNGNTTFTGTVSGITKSMVELGNVDNTSDLNKPVSTATSTELGKKANLSGATFTGNTYISSSGNLAVGSTTTPNTRLSITPSTTEAKITLWDGGSTTNHYGFGVSGGTLNYHVDTINASHKFYAGGKNGNDGNGTLLMTIDGTGKCTANNFNGLASKASHIDGGSAGQILYQSSNGNTNKLSVGSNNYILTFNSTSSAPQWSATILPSAVSGTAVDCSTNQTSIGGSKTFTSLLTADAGLTVNGNTTFNGSVTINNNNKFIGDLSGNAKGISINTGSTTTNRLLYQNTSNVTTALDAPTTDDNYVLVSSKTSEPSWTTDPTFSTLRTTSKLYIGKNDPGGGTGDKAYLEYSTVSGEKTVLRIVVENDGTGSNEDNINIKSSNNVGINTDTPAYKLDVNGSLGVNGNTTFNGSVTINNNNNNNKFIGDLSGNATTATSISINTGSTNRLLYQDSSNVTTALGVPTASNSVLVSSTSGAPSWTPDPTFGTCTATSFNAKSDYRIKENVLNLINDSNFTVDNLRPVTYTNKLSGKQDIGLIAHELQEHYPFLVSGEKDGPENQSVNYTGLIGILIKEIQELKEKVKILESNQPLEKVEPNLNNKIN